MTNTNTTAAQNGVNVTDMYIVRKNGRKIPNKVFATYEKARQWVRKRVRSLKGRVEPGVTQIPNGILYDHVDDNYRTPQLAIHGYSISKVEG